MHYPFENKELIDNGTVFPADFIAEGVDQTRGWFYTLHAIATMVKDSVSFKTVISNGLVLDKNGNKMSKRLGNAVDPFEAIGKFGSDALRWYMITNAQPWDNLKFDEEGVKDVTRKFFGTLHNTYKFFAQYANVDGFDNSAAQIPVAERPVMDRWILSELNSLTRDVRESLDDYEPTRAGRLITGFVNDYLSNWYVHLTRDRYWGSSMSRDKLAAYQTLYTCLETVARLMSPVAPFYSDRLWRDLTAVAQPGAPVSVHLADYPVCDDALVDKELETRMELAQKLTSMVLALRKRDDVKINVRKPLQKILIPVTAELRSHLEPVKDLVRDQVNVKEIEFVEGATDVLVKKVKCNFKILGKKFGPLMKGVAAAVQGMSQEDVAALERNGSFTFDINGTPATVDTTEVEIYSEDIPGWVVANEGTLTVALDIQLTDELRREGIARELKKRIQDSRKQNGLEITDRIRVRLNSNPETDAAIREFDEWIRSQVLADSIELVPGLEQGEDISFDDYTFRLQIEKIQIKP
ncbi:MAG: class I tRNA ligase family protein, partial [Bacteroidaceae bacterium]|nr:class I tRNA ligase family protein [Bacteroidaceae bacterium]